MDYNNSLHGIYKQPVIYFLQKSFGKVTVQIDRVVTQGAAAGEYFLLPESKSGSKRSLEIEFQWTNSNNMPQADA